MLWWVSIKPKNFPPLTPNTYFKIKYHIVFPQLVKDFNQVGCMLFGSLRLDYYVINIYFHDFPNLFLEYMVHQPLICFLIFLGRKALLLKKNSSFR